jgi:hypothetical protein
MKTENLNKFYKLLIRNKIIVSEIEYTKNNYDNGRLIKNDIPTITTEFCEIGIIRNKFYFVFIIESKNFNLKLFEKLQNKQNINIYGFLDFNRNLFPINNFNLKYFLKEIQKDKYLQFQFDYKNIKTDKLFEEYINLTKLFKKFVKVINQLKIDLTKK